MYHGECDHVYTCVHHGEGDHVYTCARPGEGHHGYTFCHFEDLSHWVFRMRFLIHSLSELIQLSLRARTQMGLVSYKTQL